MNNNVTFERMAREHKILSLVILKIFLDAWTKTEVQKISPTAHFQIPMILFLKMSVEISLKL